MSPSALSIVRPINVALTFGSVLLGGWLASHQLAGPLWIAALAASLIAAAGYIHNDIVDLAVDRISHPDRAIPTGRISIRSSTVLTVTGYAAGITISAFLPSPCPVLALGVVLTLILYNHVLKRLPLVGNVAVGLIGGVPFVFGGFAVQDVRSAALPALFASTFHLAREILKDLQDREGDLAAGATTLATVYPGGLSRSVVTLLLLIVAVGIPFTAFQGWAGPAFLSVGLALNGLLLLTVCLTWQAGSESELEVPSRLLKAGMIVGIVAFWLDSL